MLRKLFNILIFLTFFSVACLFVILFYWEKSTSIDLKETYPLKTKATTARQEQTQMLTNASTTLGPCPDTPPNLLGPIHVEFKTKRTLDDVRKDVGQLLQDGGLYKPPDCIAQQKVGLHQGCPNLSEFSLD